MPDIKQTLNDEIRRLARKEIKLSVGPLHEAVTVLKKQNFELKHRIAELERVICSGPDTAKAEKLTREPQVRINAAGIQRLRKKLKLTQGELAKVLGVALHTVSVWELGKSAPRSEIKKKLCALRKMGRRELKALLAEVLKAPTKAEAKAEAKAKVPAKAKAPEAEQK